jgi:hypothetical protein
MRVKPYYDDHEIVVSTHLKLTQKMLIGDVCDVIVCYH